MNAFFSTPKRIAALAVAALRWRGTPWMANSAVCQVGLSCHLGPAVLLHESGFTVDVAAVPRAPSDWARHQTRSLMTAFMATRPDMQAVFERATKNQELPEFQPGDVVGFKCGLCVHHLGMILPAYSGREGEIKPRSFFQCMHPLGATILSQNEREFSQRLAWAWRPMEATNV